MDGLDVATGQHPRAPVDETLRRPRRGQNAQVIPEASPEENPLEQDAPRHAVDDPAIRSWFLTADERRNPGTDLRVFTNGNLVTPLVDGRAYFRRLCAELKTTLAGDQIYFLDFRGDMDECLDGPGTEVGVMLGDAAERGVAVFGLLWRSHPSWLKQSEEANAELVRHISDHGGQVMLDARTRKAGSHHQKLVVIRRPDRPDLDVAFVGGIDLGFSRNDDGSHQGDPQPMEEFPDVYGARPPWHDIQAEVRGPAVDDLEHTFRERWYGSSVLDIPSPIRQLYDRAYHASAMTGAALPEPGLAREDRRGSQAVQVLRTYPARLRRYPFAPLGERSIAQAYRRAFARARRLVYLEDQYLWSADVAGVIAGALRANPELRVMVVVPRHSDKGGRLDRAPTQVGRQDAVRLCQTAGGSRFAMYDLENTAGQPVYVHAKVVVIDDVWAMIGSDNLNRRSWTHDSELSIAVLDAARDDRAPVDPAGLGDGARTFARELRLSLLSEHLDRDGDTADLVDSVAAYAAAAQSAATLERWHHGGRVGPRPPGRLMPNRLDEVGLAQRVWARPLYRSLYDPDGRPWRDKIRRRT
jgi:phosphatidylserine/phosphatidylglycerophosphate/cardiolipin synthase-like enzyme